MKKAKPIIGVTSPLQGGRLLWICTQWMIRIHGGIAQKITPGQPLDMTQYNGFVISGGGDIHPKRYHESVQQPDMVFDDARDALEYDVIHYALDACKPVLGICRGMQMMNVALGGSLHQEAKDVLDNFLPNDNMMSKIVGRRHITVDVHSQLKDIMGNDTHYYVNSIHHQAIKEVATLLRVVSKEDNGLIQAIEHAPPYKGFFIGVQWHPELMPHALHARRLFRAFICASNA